MKKRYKNLLLLTLFLFFIVFPVLIAEARSGCCSHHGGVCGCRCCDGTSLSATCLPYYPQCSSPKPTIKSPIIKPEPEPEPEPEPKAEPESIIDSSLKTDFYPTYTASIQDITSQSYNWIYWLIGIVIFGGIIWAFNRKKK